jgi:Ca2+-binding RTX toxin-like protein
MSARRIGAAVCASLALTLGSAGVAFAYGNDSANQPSPTQDPCGGGLPTVLRGTNGDDTLDARTMPAVRIICAFGGNDTIYANGAGDQIYAGPGADKITGGAFNDYIEGQGGGDYIDGGDGSDTLLGQTGDDTIISRDGVPDVVDGGTGTNHCTTDDPIIDSVKNCIPTH